MQAIRKIYNAESEELTVKLPAEFLRKQIEIIILPFEPNQLDEQAQDHSYSRRWAAFSKRIRRNPPLQGVGEFVRQRD